MFTSTIYRASPPWIQSQLVSVWGWTRTALREGARFREIEREIDRTQWYSREQIASMQLERVKAVLRHAATNVPYYRDAFARGGINVEDVRTLQDVSRLPFLEKTTLKTTPERLVAENIKGKRLQVTTSGSTGTPLVLTQNLDAVNRENAFIWRQLTWAGYRRGEPRAWLRGDMIVPADCRKPPFWRMNAGERMLMLSSYHLSMNTAPSYVSVLEKYDPVLIQAYPSAMAFLARYLQAKNQHYRGRLRSIVMTSETLLAEDIRVIEERFRCKVFEQYGSAERVTMIQTCEHGSRHVDSDYGYTEFIPMDDGRYEIVGTGFNNALMPLIRYRSGDSVELFDDDRECPCGRKLPIVKKLHGRLDDYIKTPDGRRIARLGFVFQGVAHIGEAQVVQNQIDTIVLRVVPAGELNESDRRQLIANARARLGSDIQIQIETVAAIERTRNGKLRTVVCNV